MRRRNTVSSSGNIATTQYIIKNKEKKKLPPLCKLSFFGM